MSQTIRFLLDGREVQVTGLPPTTTLLDWLREHAGRSGTKEGCAEGDCGACTVVLADAHEGRLRWQAINACIRFLPTVHGKALFTVESLRAADGALHPAQRAMVDCHGSQCGFCTPGFVMSLFGLYQTQAQPDDSALADALSGNLCRCTGYRPILAAGRQMYALPAPQSTHLPPPAWRDDPAAEADLLARLAALDDGAALRIDHPAGHYLAPRSAADFARQYAEAPHATILAGGTDVGLWVTKQLKPLPLLLHTGAVREFAHVGEYQDARGTWLEIGAAVSLEAAFAALLREYPEATELYRRFASRPIRNSGTLCGNVANGSPIGDSMPALIAVGAEVVLRRGEQLRSLPLEALYLDYRKKDLAAGEFVQAVRIPRRPAQPGFVFRAWKIAKRHDQDISAVFAGFALRLEDGIVADARLAYGGMAGIPRRAAGAEAALRGRALDAATVAGARAALANDFQPLSDMRATAGYRLQVAQNLLTRLQLELQGQFPTRIHDEESRRAAV
ncbi:xanthine dehydrogenase small subunit [Azoarcus indigens]|uniref:Xanthine dehydrogenase small subunit n=1 Tax=Azoarcus indigens TaxID=29545 RepID=A0A4R6EDC1_9RHOO|nr:xanthine dehydrogenase small subunit [Azoarcus indigens]NMG63643.1 xanthine dehydrogenase small subunit [Azoarcus indigens]TDN56177.1 xanthine dehydrogenase small subunit [Azoarcus indigens]